MDKAFMATNSLSLDAGATTPDLQQAETKKAMIGIARKVIFLCDSSKIGRESFARFAGLQQIDVLVTDQFDAPMRVCSRSKESRLWWLYRVFPVWLRPAAALSESPTPRTSDAAASH